MDPTIQPRQKRFEKICRCAVARRVPLLVVRYAEFHRTPAIWPRTVQIRAFCGHNELSLSPCARFAHLCCYQTTQVELH